MGTTQANLLARLDVSLIDLLGDTLSALREAGSPHTAGPSCTLCGCSPSTRRTRPCGTAPGAAPQFPLPVARAHRAGARRRCGRRPTASDPAAFLSTAHTSLSRLVLVTEVDDRRDRPAAFGTLVRSDRWNDTMATELERSPLTWANEHLTAGGWTPGKHGQP